MFQEIKRELICKWTKRDIFFIDKAFETAFLSDFQSSLKLGCCIVVNKKRYYTGYNQKYRTLISKSKALSLHAEIHALSNFIKMEYGQYDIVRYNKNILSNLTAYIVRIMNNPIFPPYGISKPCHRCQSFLYQHGIKYIKYTDVNESGKQILVTLIRE